jgi:3-methyladenine DNA glycosylase/8-oxoguanine DNA glycosylase
VAAAASTRTIAIDVPADFVLARDACSYGYFLLEPNHWDPLTATFTRTLDLVDGPARLDITQPTRADTRDDAIAGSDTPILRDTPLRRVLAPRGRSLVVRADRPLSAPDIERATQQLARMLRLDESHRTTRAFHRVDPRWKRTGFARLCRSATFFEDLIKTVTSCNVAWPSTVAMNRRLCEHFGRASPAGGRTFPSARTLARARPASLRARCGVGYRDQRIVELARLVDSGRVDPDWFESPQRTDDELRDALLELPGIGPYAANNIMQLLGRYAHIPLDSESLRHARSVLNMRGSDRQLFKRLAAHFAPMGEHRFRSYWFELWAFYEAKRGPSWTWQKHVVGTSFTASQLQPKQTTKPAKTKKTKPAPGPRSSLAARAQAAPSASSPTRTRSRRGSAPA